MSRVVLAVTAGTRTIVLLPRVHRELLQLERCGLMPPLCTAHDNNVPPAATPRMASMKFGMTPTAAIERLSANDPTLTVCDLTKSAVLQMKGAELMPKIADALSKNTHCAELKLGECNISDAIVADLASALTKNTALVSLDLQSNKVGNEGATSLAKALAANRTLMVLNLFGQQGGHKLGDATLHAFCDMFDTNVTLLKITWRLDSRQSFRINKLLVRNNDIDRRIKSGRDYADLLPQGVAPLDAHLIAQRDAASHLVGSTSRNTSSSDLSARISQGASGRMSSSEESVGAPPPPPSVPLWRSVEPKPPAAESPELAAALAALDAEYDQKAAELKASFESRRAAMIASHKTVDVS